MFSSVFFISIQQLAGLLFMQLSFRVITGSACLKLWCREFRSLSSFTWR